MNIKDYNEKEYISEEEKLWELPLIPLRGLSLFPETVIHFDVGREKSKAAIDYAMEHKQQIMLITQRELMVEDPEPEDLYEVGTRAIVKQILKMPGDIIRVLVEVKERLTISSFMQFEPFIMVEANEVHNQMILTKEEKALLKMVKEAFYTYMGYGKNQSTEMLDAIEEIEEPNKLIDIIGSNLMIDVEQAQVLLSETDVRKRLEDTYTLLVDEIEILEMEKDIDSKVKSQLDKHQKEYYLREQIKAIQEELGEDQTLDQVDDYLTRLKALNLEESTHKKVEKEIQKLNKTPSGSSEASVIQTYIEWILDLPWNKETDETIDIKNAREILDADHYALDKVKERVLEYLAVLKLSQKMTGPILCLVGPPGVGKTSIAKSIARALDR
ncbi:MAG TPA: endopeptidase La, partial [Eubacteriaceae bacterium]|nr:endopeptidase La [Eubacteriaceae bacterium]